MKTRRETTAEIASDVRKATRERAEADIAEEKALKLELYKEKRANQRVRKEKNADFYFKLALLVLTSTAATCLTLLIKGESTAINWMPVGCGLVLAVIFILYANCLLK